MRRALTTALLLALSACTTVPPEDMLARSATPATYTAPNGDVITEYRNGGRLVMVKVVPLRGPTYYIYDRNGDGIVDERDNRGGPMTYYKLFSW
ncbi:DUF2782 domain-containing protein [Thermomonas alba]|uniref:DUF2782 domain-containing protein n=1 Tax=Thermomonas alba TaxID=2888525 RepID=UPI001F04FC57|nr:DUF2782 domain-containing protein [Thermomonas alba]